jgi:PAS domain S-box-containing protein
LNEPALILYLEDNPRDAELVRDRLQRSTLGCELRVASDRAEYEAALSETRFDLILSDYRLPGYDGLAALELARAKQPHVPFILVSGTLGDEQAVDCVLRGATDYVLKHRLERLVPAVLRALSESKEQQKRRSAEDALRKSEETHRALFRNSRDALVTLAPPSWQFTTANPAAIALFGAIDESDFVSRTPWQHSPERQPDGRASLEKAREMIEAAMLEGSTLFDWVHARLSGETFPAEVLLSRIETNGDAWLQANIRDITERTREEAAQASLEAQLRESQKMEAIGTLAGGIAHDFNNILATILGNVELARQDLTASPLALESLEEIRKAASRARDLVQQILSFSRRQPTERQPTSLAPVVDEAVRLLRATLPARLTLEVHCDAEVPAVLADGNQIEQVLINLITNAMQASRSGPGRIGIRLDTVTLDAALVKSQPALDAMHARRPGPAVRIAVTDDGEGMDAATLRKAFEPFFTTRAGSEGTGLGLSVVHGIVKGHDGAIVVESEPGKGSTFTVHLPAVEAGDDRAAQVSAPGVDGSAGARAADPEGAGSVGTGGGQHILYVDDDESLVFLVDRLLKRRGFRVSGFTNQAAALVALRADPALFDLVVTDYNMPGMSGLDVAREVHAIRADLPVAVASGFVDEALRAQASAAGVRELIFKANAAEDLCEAFARLARTVGGRPIA